MSGGKGPPRWVEALLELAIEDPRIGEGILGDLAEEYHERASGRGGAPTSRFRASVWYTGTALSVAIRHRWARGRRAGDGHTREADMGSGKRGSVVADTLMDIRVAGRSFAKRPAFLAVAVGTLALGIGANTAIFSVVNGVLIEPLPYPDPDALVRVGHRGMDGSYGLGVASPGNLVDWRERARSFAALAGYSSHTLTWIPDDRPAERLVGTVTLGSIFDVLGVAPLMGRTYTTMDDAAGPEHTVVVSHGLWQRVWGDEDPVGRSLVLEGEPYEVVAVMPEGFVFPDRETQFWVPSSYDEVLLDSRTEFFLLAIARLSASAPIERAQEEMDVVAARLRDEHPEANENVGVTVVGLQEYMVADSRVLLTVLLCAVAFVLLIACLNLASLLLSRAAAHESDVAVRQALGATRWRICRQLVAESTLLTLLGAAAGLVAGSAFLRGIVAWLPGGIPRTDEIGIDGRVLAFTACIALASAVIFGVFPILAVLRRDVANRIRSRAGLRTGRLGRGWLVGAEVALATILLVGAGLLARSFSGIIAVDSGFQSENRLTFRVSLPDHYSLPERVAFFQGVEEGLGQIRGAVDIGVTSALPTSDYGSQASLNVIGEPGRDAAFPHYRVVNPDYLATMGIPLLNGRSITRRDGLSGTPSVVVNQSFAEHYWPGEDPVGRQITLGPNGGWIPPSTIVGIVGDVRMTGLDAPVPPTVYAPHELMPWWSAFHVVLHAEVDAALLAREARRVVGSLDASVPVYELRALDDLVGASLAPRRNSMTLLGLLALVAITMAAVGVFGVLSYHVAQRRRELGVRIAIGADSAAIRRSVFRQGMLPVAVGTGVGLLGALALTRFMESLLFQVSALDAGTLATVPLVLAATAVLAMLVPAWSASRVDPVEALSAD